MSRQKLLVLCLVVVTFTGCNHHRRHPHAFRQPGLNGSCDHHHGQCRKCGRRAARRHGSYQSLFPGDIYGYYGACGDGCLDGCCGIGFMECGGCGPYQSCSACEMPYANSCSDCGSSPAMTSYSSCTGCSGCGMPMSSPAGPAASSPGCNCNQQQAPLAPPQQALPPVPQDAKSPAETEPNFNGDATLPMGDPPAAVPPIDPVSWQIPQVP